MIFDEDEARNATLHLKKTKKSKKKEPKVLSFGEQLAVEFNEKVRDAEVAERNRRSEEYEQFCTQLRALDVEKIKRELRASVLEHVTHETTTSIGSISIMVATVQFDLRMIFNEGYSYTSATSGWLNEVGLGNPLKFEFKELAREKGALDQKERKFTLFLKWNIEAKTEKG